MDKEQYTPNCFGLKPCIGSDCRILILGSMPGTESLRQQQYYAYPQNRFWPLMANILTNSEPPTDYAARLDMLISHHVGLWDAIGSCECQGSLDTSIHNAVGNDISLLLQKNPSITIICCNGAKSFQCFKKWNKPLLKKEGLEVFSLPSTSPANAQWKMDMLIAKWVVPFQSAGLI